MKYKIITFLFVCMFPIIGYADEKDTAQWIDAAREGDFQQLEKCYNKVLILKLKPTTATACQRGNPATLLLE